MSLYKEKPGLCIQRPGFSILLCIPLALANSEHLGSASWADTLGSWLAILHGDGFGVLHFLFASTFDTISLHVRLLIILL